MAIFDASFTILSAIILVLTTYVILTVYNIILKDDKKCYRSIPKYTLKSINTSSEWNTLSKKCLTDFYIKTAYNCCSVNENFVNKCALLYTIKENCRCLDFEIHDSGGKPVVGTSLKDNNIGMDSFNSIKLEEVFLILSKAPFNSEVCQCNNDPLIVNLRIKSTLSYIYDIVAYVISQTLSSRLLSIEYSYMKYDEDEKLKDNPYWEHPKILRDGISNFVNKIIISVSDCDLKILKQSELSKLVNIVGSKATKGQGLEVEGSPLMFYTAKVLSNGGASLVQVNNSQVVGENRIGNIDSYISNRGFMIISIPDDMKYKNVNYCYYKKKKINMIGMLFQKKVPSYYERSKNVPNYLESTHVGDNILKKTDLIEYEEIGNLDNYILWFARNGNAFIYKDADVDSFEDEDDDENNNNGIKCESNDVWNSYKILKNDNTKKTTLRKSLYNRCVIS
jgi:hypothetical protein